MNTFDGENLLVCDGLHRTMNHIGRRVLRLRQKRISIKEKEDFRDIVTAADFLSEHALAEYVAVKFPEDGLRGEEGTSRASTSGFEWILDPIDGTANYAANLPFFAISAGRTQSGRSVLGAVYFPAEKHYFFAVRGKGAWRRDSSGVMQSFPNSKSPDKLSDAVIALGATSGHEHLFGIFRHHCRNVLALGSFVYETRLVATGQLGAYLHTGATPFDAAAATLIAEEAGCIVRRFDEKEIDLRENTIPVIIAGNRALFDEIISILQNET